jgi:uncharacterized protein with von Willebrand factor type A (vWA) domain
MRCFLETLEKQPERHDGGDRWIDTGGSHRSVTVANTRALSASADPREAGRR